MMQCRSEAAGHFNCNATLFLSWGPAGTLVAGPIVDLLLKQGTDVVFAYRMAFVGAIVLTVIDLMILLSLFVMLKRQSKGDCRNVY